MIEHANETVVLADNSKFCSTYSALFANFKDIDRVVTDLDADRLHIEKLTAQGIEVDLA
jgi:DeoR/GlpR family transcriptional regulator of sugar metabolism